jgi:hypothetical protein
MGSDEHLGQNFSEIEKNFLYNIKEFKFTFLNCNYYINIQPERITIGEIMQDQKGKDTTILEKLFPLETLLQDGTKSKYFLMYRMVMDIVKAP